ncbi:hypothetical protein JTE90_000558 [Oedothorax gibbosus]|uniref:Protoporphyrinogen oxidase n=1 Tax=Oedothorax gibbosus TaxID=931172 RepID=A0AAV6VXM3_9ARAC|nr:hypothetical protein JTE90_000558 [Oedothorax gibbosus]
MATVAILGGGISGLSCAYYLKTLGSSKLKYVFLLDKSPKFGGWIQTTRFPDGAVFEHGPRTLRVGTKAGYNALVLADKLALMPRILPLTKDHPTAKTNFILTQNELTPIPRGFKALFTRSPLFSEKLPIRYLFHELNCKREILEDESVYDFARRRIGDEVARKVLDPMCRGISAGDARELSIRSMFPGMYESEVKHGSVIKGSIRDGQEAISGYRDFAIVQKAQREFWRMWTLKTGLTELIDALACTVEERGVTDLIFDAKCSGLTFKDNKAMVAVDNENIQVDHIFSSIPSQELSPLVQSYPTLAEELKSIPSVDVAVVYLEYTGDVLQNNGFGFLAPSHEDSKVLGIVFDSCCFSEMNGNSKTRITCMIGGRWFKEVLGDPETVSEDAILKLAVSAAGKHLRISEQPVRHKVVLQRQCIPQYVLGHHKKLEKIDEEIKKHNLCMSLIGASYKGAGVPDCIYNAKLSVEKYLSTL